ncbi:MAG: c-type cytochrome, partial [Planctomycetota bacterium]|nr:c-type cytochrome [Planctomycetota bacterium]
GVNRAYRSDTLDGDGYLQKWTGCCGVFVEGDKVINAFNCEPCGNLIHGSTITIDGQLLESFELLTSTDERFRPVNLFPGPDGAIYVVDMYRGIFQHKVYLTSYLRSYSEKLGLEKPGNNGRIWKIYRTNAEPLATNQLNPAEATQAQLVSMLDHPNKWWRDAAQRLLIDGEQLTTETIALLQQSKSLHATYTLEAIGRLRCQDLVHLLESKDEQRRLVALRLLSDVSDSENIKQLLPIINDLPSSQLTRWQQQLLQNGATTSSTDSKNSSPEAELFMQSCSVCHGTDALGIDKLAPSLIGSPFLNKSDDELSKLIAEGNNIMPPVNSLNANQRQQIINYLRTL